MAPYFCHSMAGDLQPDLMYMYQAIQNGWVPPDHISEDNYEELKHCEPSELRGFAGFGCSRSGRFFGGYAKSADGRNYASESKRFLMRLAPYLKTTGLVRCDYSQFKPFPGTVVYADPPYAGVEGFGAEFDHSRFWKTMNEWRAAGVRVFVSEYTAPSDWTCISELELSKGTAKGKRQNDKLWC